MKVIMATWMDSVNQPYLTEFYDSDIFESEILDYFIQSKLLHKYKVIAQESGYVVFSDGTRVVLTLHHVKANIYDEGQPTVKETQYLRITE